MNERIGGVLIGLGIGALIGAGVTMLASPWSGQETRGKVKDAFKRGTERVGQGLESVKGRVVRNKAAADA